MYSIDHYRSASETSRMLAGQLCPVHMLNTGLYYVISTINEPVHEISNNVVCATSKASDQPAHTRSQIRAFASCLSIL